MYYIKYAKNTGGYIKHQKGKDFFYIKHKMKILLIDNETILLDKLKSLISEDEIIHKWNDLSDINIKQFDIIILSGGSKFPVVGSERMLFREINIIKNFNKSILGICFGFELLTDACGGKLERMQVKKKGITKLTVVKNDIIFGGRDSFEVYESHRWKIKETPLDFDVLAVSEHGIAVIKHKNKQIYGFQFHPEHCVDTTYGAEIFFNTIKQIKNSL